MRARPAAKRTTRHRAAVVLLLAVAALAVPAHAGEPVLHEYIEPDPLEDVQLETTDFSGSMPAAMNTESGVVQAPKERRRPAGGERAYGGAGPSSLDATYQIDSDTRQPDVVSYDDPFSPAVTPFKRMFAYDTVNEALDLVVGDKTLRELAIGGEVQTGDDAFYGDMFVDVEKNVPARIPSVGPGARVLAAHVDPPGDFKLLRDGADNWFLRMDRRARVRLVVRLAIERAVFGSDFAPVGWEAIAPRATRLPDAGVPAAREVADQIGVSDAMRPREVVARLVSYFRGFAPSDLRPTSRGVRLYRDLALSQRGVCRHRSYAFVVTALDLGIPARLVRNEAHAWVEVWDSRLWHRIDLGGAANRLDAPPEDDRPHHVLPDDPYGWPEGSDRGVELAQHRAPAGAGGAGPAPASSSVDPFGPPGEAVEQAADDGRPESSLTVRVDPAPRLFRGSPLSLSGRVEADGDPCAYARVDVALERAGGEARGIGSLAAGDDGRYHGKVVIPLDAEVGEHEVVVSTPGDARCGRGTGR